MKFAVKNHLLQEWLTGSNFPGIAKEKLKEAFQSFVAVREKFSPLKDGQQADTAWMVGGKESLSLAAEFLDEVVYSSEFDGRYRDALKSKHEYSDFLDYPSVKKRVEAIEAALRKEISPTDGEGVAASASAAGATSETQTAGVGESSAASNPEVDSKLTQVEQEQWRQIMLRNLRTQVRFVSDNKSASELERLLRDCPFAMLKGDPTGLVLFHFDVKKYGESNTRPDLRVTPLRDAPCSRLVKTVLQARQSEGKAATLQPGEVAVLLDGGKKGNINKLLAPWKEGTRKEKKKVGETEAGGGDEDLAASAGEEEQEDEDDGHPDLVSEVLQIAYTEESLNARRKKTRGTCSLKQVELAHVLSSKRLSLPSRPRKHYPGSSTGDLIQGVALPAIAEEWMLPWKDKKALYGKKNFIPVGGKTETDDKSSDMNRLANKPEAVCYHSMPGAFLDELMHQFWTKLVIDLTPGDGRFGYEALKNRVGYLGITFTPEHTTLLEQRMLDLMKKDMSDSNSPLFNAAYAEALGIKASKDKNKENKDKEKGKKKDGQKDGETEIANKNKRKKKEEEEEKDGKAKPKKAKKKKDDDEVVIDSDEDEEDKGDGEDDDEEVWDPLA